MRDTDERQHPHPHESLLYHTNVFSTEDLIHLCSRPTCLLIYQFLPPSLLAWNHIPQNQSHGPGCDSAECTGQVLIPSIFQILCKSNVKKAHCINTLKICLSLSLFSCSPMSLYLPVFMPSTHSKVFFLSLLGAWLIQRPTPDK